MGHLRMDRTLNADAGRADAIIKMLAKELMGGERWTGSCADGRNDDAFACLSFRKSLERAEIRFWANQPRDL